MLGLDRGEEGLKPRPFDYVRAESLEHACAVLQAQGEDAAVLAGGQSLVPALNMRLGGPETLIDISRLDELAGIAREGDVLRVGALARHVDVMASAEVARHAPLIARAMPHVAHAAIRNRGTFGGSLCNADPAAELPACVLALDARLTLQSAGGAREVAARDFFEGTYATCRRDDEILVSVAVPVARQGTRVFFDEVVRRRGDYAIAGLAAQAAVVGGRLDGPRLVFFAVSDMAVAAPEAEALLDGVAPGEIDGDAVCAALDGLELIGDLTTSAAAKRAMMKALLRRALGAFAEGEGAP